MIVISVASLGLALAWVVGEAWVDGWLLYDGRTGQAVVTAKHGHGRCSYQYKVGDQIYTGNDGRPDDEAEPEPPYETPVYFSASHPWISGLRSGDKRIGEFPLVLMVLIGWALLLALWFVGARAARGNR